MVEECTWDAVVIDSYDIIHQESGFLFLQNKKQGYLYVTTFNFNIISCPLYHNTSVEARGVQKSNRFKKILRHHNFESYQCGRNLLRNICLLVSILTIHQVRMLSFAIVICNKKLNLIIKQNQQTQHF